MRFLKYYILIVEAKTEMLCAELIYFKWRQASMLKLLQRNQSVKLHSDTSVLLTSFTHIKTVQSFFKVFKKIISCQSLSIRPYTYFTKLYSKRTHRTEAAWGDKRALGSDSLRHFRAAGLLNLSVHQYRKESAATSEVMDISINNNY